MTRIATKVTAFRKQIAELTEYTDYVESLPETPQEFLQRITSPENCTITKHPFGILSYRHEQHGMFLIVTPEMNLVRIDKDLVIGYFHPIYGLGRDGLDWVCDMFNVEGIEFFD